MTNKLLAGVMCMMFMTVFTGCAPKADFKIEDVVVREMAPGRDVGVAYLSLHNQSKQSLVLNYVHSPRTDRIEVHRHLYEDGLMKMREVKHLAIDPGARLEFAPGGHHLMLFGVDTPFKSGESVEFTFEFENHPPQTVTAEVKRL